MAEADTPARDHLADAEHARDLYAAELSDAENALMAAKRRRSDAERHYVAACNTVANIALQEINEWKASKS